MQGRVVEEPLSFCVAIYETTCLEENNEIQ